MRNGVAPETRLDDFWPPYATVAPRRKDSGRPEHARRKKPLSRDEIVQTAVALADEEGAHAVNMRRIAKELDVSAMSLYWHVADKEQLLDLMHDAVQAEYQQESDSGGWRTDLTQIAKQKRRSLLRHPWVADFISDRSPHGPNALLHIEGSLAVLDGFGLDTRTTLQILMTLDTYVTGAVLSEVREIRAQQTQANAGLTPSEIADGMRDWQERLRRSGMFTRILQVLEQGIDPDATETRDERFDFGLNCVLDGIAAQLP